MAKLYFPGSKASQKASRQVTKGELQRIRKGIYITACSPEETVSALNNEWMDVASYIFPEPVAVTRTAVELKPAEGRLYFVSSQLKQVRTVKVGQLKFDISPGNTTSGVEQFSLNMKRIKSQMRA